MSGVARRLLIWTAVFIAGAGAVFLVLSIIWLSVAPVSTLMLARHASGQPVTRDWVSLEQIAPALRIAVVASEDGQFCRHHGVDWGALREVFVKSDAGGPERGASTITMQTVKNLFLWPSRSVLRKGIEIPMALILDRLWGKHRMLEVYLNIVEWGDGLYGAQAAARHYFNKPASALSAEESALLATSLPNPKLRDPAHPGALQRRLAAIVERRAVRLGAILRCLRS